MNDPCVFTIPFSLTYQLQECLGLEGALGSLIFTGLSGQERKNKKCETALESYIKEGFCLRHLSLQEEMHEEFHHFDTALITTDAFRIRPNSICL